MAAEQKTPALEAVLDYAAGFGWKTFPANLEDGAKKSYLSKKHAVGGENWGQTNDPKQLVINFSRRKWRLKCGVGLPTGIGNHVFIVETDTKKVGHRHDGAASLAELEAKHGALPATRMAMSPSGSVHHYFTHPGDGIKVWCSDSRLGPGIDVKGDGGMVIAPPSVRRDGAYVWLNDLPIAPAPDWLLALVTTPTRAGGVGTRLCRPFDGKAETDAVELADVMNFIPNEEFSWKYWADFGLRIFKVSGGGAWGFEIFDAWSQQCPKWFDPKKKMEVGYDKAYTRQRWEEMKGTPPDRTGMAKLRKIAGGFGWTPALYAQPASYPSEGGIISDVERGQIRKRVREFLDGPERNLWLDGICYMEWVQRDYRRWRRSNPQEKPETFVLPPVEWAIKVVMGGGKTSIVIEEIANWLKERGREVTPIVFQVTTHELAEEVKAKFVEHEIDARIIRGYLAPDPNNPLNKAKLARDPNTPKHELALMCRIPELVTTAMKAKMPVPKTCCKNGKLKCPYLEGEWICPFQAQMPAKDDPPQVFITCSDMLFFDHKVFKDVKRNFIDENFWQKGVRGIKDKDKDDDNASEQIEVPLAALLLPPGSVDTSKLANHLWFRDILAEAVLRQANDGGLESRYFWDRIDGSICHQAKIAEWAEYKRLGEQLGLYPGMREIAEVKKDKKKQKLIDAMRLSRQLITIWQELRELLRHPEISISGRLLLDTSNNLRVMTWRGIEPIHQPFNRLPTLLLDAVLPPQQILQLFYDNVQVVADINARPTPHARVLQILGAPTSANKLIRADGEENRLAVWHYILQEYLAIGRKETLVICQKKFENWLLNKGLPENIHVEHYYDIAGNDNYRDVALEILVGAPRPGPREIEAKAGALSGEWQEPVPEGPTGFAWYLPAKPAPGIRLLDNGDDGIRTRGDYHPAAMSEMVRWLTTEGELINAYGRARAINRSAANPGDIHCLFDTCLPISVYEVKRWEEKKANPLVVEARDGLVPEQADELMLLWPARWKTLRAARWALRDGVWVPPGFVRIQYRFAGRKGHKPGRLRVAYYDPHIIPDPKVWLEERLGRRLVLAAEPSPAE